ncbi:MAG: ferrochelatase [Saprospiraceae bacterium]|nr:ferrochelatase [Saprospiraceae bacterium]
MGNFEGKIGVLLVNLGSPDAPEPKSVYRYLIQFLTDKRVIDLSWLKRQILVRGIIVPRRYKTSTHGYQQLWTKDGSPLKVYGEKLKLGMQQVLGNQYVVALGMRYQNPSIQSAVDELLDANITKLVVFPLYPQYASSSTGTVVEEVLRCLSKELTIVPMTIVPSFYSEKSVNNIFADHARKLNIERFDHVLFSYHGLPVRHLVEGCRSGYCKSKEGCCNKIIPENQHCYGAHCHATTKEIAKTLGLKEDKYTLCFQSRLGSEPWLEPYTTDVLKDLAAKGKKKVLVFSPAFVADCLETLVEIKMEYRDEFLQAGGEELVLVPSLNDDPAWIKVASEMVKANSW